MATFWNCGRLLFGASPSVGILGGTSPRPTSITTPARGAFLFKALFPIATVLLILFPAFIISFEGSKPAAGVGDSYLILCPSANLDKFGSGNMSLLQLEILVKNLPDQHYETVYILAGVANVLYWDCSLDETQEDLKRLAWLCSAKFHARRVVVYDPAEMFRLLENPENRRDAIHLNVEAYGILLASTPLYILK